MADDLQPKLFENVQIGVFLVNQRVKKPVAVQVNEWGKAGKVSRRFHFWNDNVFEANGLLATFLRIFQVNVFELANGNVQRVNAFEIVAGLFFKIYNCIAAAAGVFRRQFEAERKYVRLAGLVFHDVELAKVEAHERDVNFFSCERGAVVFDINFRYVQKRRAAKFGRIVEPEILNPDRRRSQREMETADFRVHAGLRPDAVFDGDTQNRIIRQQQNDDCHDDQHHDCDEQPEEPFENEFHLYFRFSIYNLRAGVELRNKS